MWDTRYFLISKKTSTDQKNNLAVLNPHLWRAIPPNDQGHLFREKCHGSKVKASRRGFHISGKLCSALKRWTPGRAVLSESRRHLFILTESAQYPLMCGAAANCFVNWINSNTSPLQMIRAFGIRALLKMTAIIWQTDRWQAIWLMQKRRAARTRYWIYFKNML